MSSISTIIRGQGSLVYAPPCGKPDGNGGTKIQKGIDEPSSSLFYLFNYLRKRTGPDTLTEKERTFEKLCSTRRKQLRFFESINCEQDQLSSLQAQHDYNLLTFAGYSLEGLMTAVFSEENGYSKAAQERLKAIYADPNTDAGMRLTFTRRWIASVMFDQFKLQKANWNPESPIHQLISELNSKGYLAVFGPIVAAHEHASLSIDDEPDIQIQSTAELDEKVGNHSVFEWKADAYRRDPLACSLTGVLVIGAKIDGFKQSVYFIDPSEQNDPANPIRVYKMRYMEFCHYARNIHGLEYSAAFVNTPFAVAAPASLTRLTPEPFDLIPLTPQLVGSISLSLLWKGASVLKGGKTWIDHIRLKHPSFIDRKIYAEIAESIDPDEEQLLTFEEKKAPYPSPSRWLSQLKVETAFFNHLEMIAGGVNTTKKNGAILEKKISLATPYLLVPGQNYVLTIVNPSETDFSNIQAEVALCHPFPKS